MDVYWIVCFLAVVTPSSHLAVTEKSILFVQTIDVRLFRCRYRNVSRWSRRRRVVIDDEAISEKAGVKLSRSNVPEVLSLQFCVDSTRIPTPLTTPFVLFYSPSHQSFDFLSTQVKNAHEKFATIWWTKVSIREPCKYIPIPPIPLP